MDTPRGAQLVLSMSNALQKIYIQNIYYVLKIMTREGSVLLKCQLCLFFLGRITSKTIPSMWTGFDNLWSAILFAVYNDFILFHVTCQE